MFLFTNYPLQLRYVTCDRPISQPNIFFLAASYFGQKFLGHCTLGLVTFGSKTFGPKIFSQFFFQIFFFVLLFLQKREDIFWRKLQFYSIIVQKVPKPVTSLPKAFLVEISFAQMSLVQLNYSSKDFSSTEMWREWESKQN